MEGRSTRQCRERYKTYLSPQILNAPWTPQDDQFLIEKYQEIGPRWAEIARLFKNRSDNNIKNRWYTHLKPRVQISSPIMIPSTSNVTSEGCSVIDNYYMFDQTSVLDQSWTFLE